MRTIERVKNKIVIAFISLCLVLFLSSYNDVSGQNHQQGGNGGQVYEPSKDDPNGINGGGHGNGNGNTMGAPLDGGLVSILLAGAGIAYYNKRKKKNQE